MTNNDKIIDYLKSNPMNADSMKLIQDIIKDTDILDINKKDINIKKSPLHIATSKSNMDMVKYLLDNGADININSKKFWESKFHVACREGNIDVISAFLEQGLDKINVDATDSNGNSLLHIASCYGRYEIVEMLVINGAKTELLNNKKQTAFDVAKKEYTKCDDEELNKEHEKIISLLKNPHRLLVEKQAGEIEFDEVYVV